MMRTATIQTAAHDERDARKPAPRLDTSIIVVTSAELAECTCPEWCERDHDRD